MRKVIILFALILVLFCGCEEKRVKGIKVDSDGISFIQPSVNKICSMVIIAEDEREQIWLDENTGCLYYKYSTAYGCGITPVFNQNGSIKTIKDCLLTGGEDE